MFQFRRFPSLSYLIQIRIYGLFPYEFPHSEICGSMVICTSPQLIAAYHVFHRLSVPRHPPCALIRLTWRLESPAGWFLSHMHSVACSGNSNFLKVFTTFGLLVLYNQNWLVLATSDVLTFYIIKIRLISVFGFQGTNSFDCYTVSQNLYLWYRPWSLYNLLYKSFSTLFSFNLAATYSPVPSPAKYHRPLRS